MRLLLVEDERLMREAVSDYFVSKGWEVVTADNGEEASERFATDSFQLVLLDVMMPGMNGFTVCRKIREVSDVPVIFLTARVLEEDKLHGYALGADDYITKPFSLPVLHAKAMALMGRVRGADPHTKIRCREIEVDVRTREVWVQGRSISLPPKEYELLLFFLENPGRIFDRNTLLLRFWGYDFDGSDRVVDNHIKNLRAALGAYGSMIRTVRKAGYRWTQE